MTNREIDLLVAKKVTGCYVRKQHWEDLYALHVPGVIIKADYLSREDAWTGVPHYSTDIAAAWEVVQHLKDRDGSPHYLWLSYQGDSILTKTNSSHWLCAFSSPEKFRAEADTAPMAICLAALKAVGVEIEV